MHPVAVDSGKSALLRCAADWPANMFVGIYYSSSRLVAYIFIIVSEI